MAFYSRPRKEWLLKVPKWTYISQTRSVRFGGWLAYHQNTNMVLSGWYPFPEFNFYRRLLFPDNGPSDDDRVLRTTIHSRPKWMQSLRSHQLTFNMPTSLSQAVIVGPPYIPFSAPFCSIIASFNTQTNHKLYLVVGELFRAVYYLQSEVTHHT